MTINIKLYIRKKKITYISIPGLERTCHWVQVVLALILWMFNQEFSIFYVLSLFITSYMSTICSLTMKSILELLRRPCEKILIVTFSNSNSKFSIMLLPLTITRMLYFGNTPLSTIPNPPWNHQTSTFDTWLLVMNNRLINWFLHGWEFLIL
jgi:hypothetical protein